MKSYYIYIMIGLFFILANCGGSAGGTEFGNPDGTGTVVVKSSIGTIDTSAQLKYVTEEGSADEVLVRTYRVSLGDSEDCEEATFEDIFDETDDTSDCTSPPSDTSLFLDIAQTPTMGSSSITADTYSCIRITICDQLVWTSATLDGCPGTNVSDISDPRAEGNIITFYYSTNGSFEEGEGNEELGQIDNPFLLTNSVTVTEDETTTLLVLMSNNNDGDAMIGEYDSENDEEYQCEIPSPRMTLTTE